MVNNRQKLELTWIGKDNQPRLEPRILIEDPEKSYGHTPHPSQEGNKKSPLLGGDSGVGNMLIYGDNLLALKALEQDFAGKIKCACIDPPYNTGNAFEHYDDGLEHSIWLSLMKPRIEIIHRLLRDDGTLWIFIDDDESHYLKVLCDEIFGRKNFVNNVIWEKKTAPQANSLWFTDSHDHILVFAKSKEIWRPNLMPRTDEQNARYNRTDDPRGLYTPDNFTISLTGGARGAQYAKTGKSNNIYEITLPSGRKVLPPKGRCWLVREERYFELLADNMIVFAKGGDGVPMIKRFLKDVQEGTVPLTILHHKDVGGNTEAKREVANFNSESIFATPKPERLIKRILELGTNPGDWVLDSFLGSGTTAAVAHKMGRRWIGIELGEHCHTHCLPRLRKVVDGTDQGGISKIVHTPGSSQVKKEPTPNPSQEGNKKVPSSEGKQGWVDGKARRL
ncbi:MAG TPA: site-specific DNA-methyltransferase [Candidatus Brocadia sapporoensis]|nr:site-specific DNA-methyltransferase [Candidatus Brocadia sp.]HQU30352.1 site-specific DNA-methyltransferase [Candidatus Brocadia sapporoensis]